MLLSRPPPGPPALTAAPRRAEPMSAVKHPYARHLLTTSFLAAALLLSAIWVLRIRDAAQDDFFISYTYARNLAEGHGFVYNRDAAVFGLTNPGLALLQALGHVVTGLSVPWVGTLLTAAGLLGCFVLLLLEGRQIGRTVEAGVGGLLLLGSSWLWSTNGGAWPLVFTLALIAARLQQTRPWVAGVLIGYAVWARPDAVLAVGPLALLMLIAERKLPVRFGAVRFGLAAGAVILLGMALAYWYFGAVLPQTLGAKQLTAAASAADQWTGLRFWQRAVPLFPRHFGTYWPFLFLVGGGGLVVWFRAARRGGSLGGQLLVLYGVALAIAYPLLGIPFFSWYASPPLAILLVGCGYAVGGVGRSAVRAVQALGASRGREPSPGLRGGGATLAGLVSGLLLLGGLLWTYLPATHGWYQGYHGFGHLDTYRRGAEWIRENTDPAARIAYVEIGVLGYYAERDIQDLLGLVSPEVLPYVATHDLVGAFLVRPTELVAFHSRGRMGPIIHAPWFPGTYRAVAFFPDRGTDPADRKGLTIYQRRKRGQLPKARPPRPLP